MSRGATIAAAALLVGCQQSSVVAPTTVAPSTAPAAITIPLPPRPATTTTTTSTTSVAGSSPASVTPSARATTSTPPPAASTTTSSRPAVAPDSVPATNTIAPPSAPLSATVVDASASNGEREGLNALAERAQRRFGTSDGIAVALMHHGTLIGTYVSGHDVHNQPIGPDARFRVASISKVVTATAVMRLIDDGKLTLDTKLVDVWRPSKIGDPRLSQITVRQLLGHTSGIRKLRDTFFGQQHTWQQTADIAAASSLDNAPGTVFAYSNANFTILGRVIEALTGGPYERAAERLVFEPLGITTARLIGTRQQPAGDPVYSVGQARTYMETLGPAGQWAMSAADVARLGSQYTADGPLLSEAMRTASRTPNGADTRADEWNYGLGMMLFLRGDGHTGTIESARNVVITLPNGYTVAIVGSTVGVDSGEGMLKAFLPQVDRILALPEPPPRAVSIPTTTTTTTTTAVTTTTTAATATTPPATTPRPVRPTTAASTSS